MARSPSDLLAGCLVRRPRSSCAVFIVVPVLCLVLMVARPFAVDVSMNVRGTHSAQLLDAMTSAAQQNQPPPPPPPPKTTHTGAHGTVVIVEQPICPHSCYKRGECFNASDPTAWPGGPPEDAALLHPQRYSGVCDCEFPYIGASCRCTVARFNTRWWMEMFYDRS